MCVCIYTHTINMYIHIYIYIYIYIYVYIYRGRERERERVCSTIGYNPQKSRLLDPQAGGLSVAPGPRLNNDETLNPDRCMLLYYP